MSPRSLWRSLLSHPRLWSVPLVWAVVVLVGLIALRATMYESGEALPAVAAALAATAILALLGLSLLGIRFYRGIRTVRDHLYRGEYEEALEAAHAHASVAVGAGFESALKRLLDFDRRRAEKVATATRLLNSVLREAPVAILLGDLESDQIRFSRLLCERFGVHDDRFPLDALLRLPANTELGHLWDRLARGEESSAEVGLTLHLPVRQAAQRLDLRLVTVQNDAGRIVYILGFADPAPPAPQPVEHEVTATE